MPKKPDVTNVQIEAAAAKADDLAYDLRDLADEIRAGRCENFDKVNELSRKFATLARVAADVTSVILTRDTMRF